MYPSSASYKQSAQKTAILSEDLLRLLVRLLTVISLCVFLLGNVLRWYIHEEQVLFDHLMVKRAELLAERDDLLARRDHLASESRIVAAATVRLGLHLPEKDQEHRLY